MELCDLTERRVLIVSKQNKKVVKYFIWFQKSNSLGRMHWPIDVWVQQPERLSTLESDTHIDPKDTQVKIENDTINHSIKVYNIESVPDRTLCPSESDTCS
ncbi:hypothetical protein AYI70_g340 [Smittium culicis]|uniref:Uncharacterized protein n=1 Tax=Smittium culicis TaxID=133412 RepID=A0A1R1YH40_9FUNG|nr:hypothetical protein AYI70_g340 [Smittium culicis]